MNNSLFIFHEMFNIMRGQNSKPSTCSIMIYFCCFYFPLVTIDIDKVCSLICDCKVSYFSYCNKKKMVNIYVEFYNTLSISVSCQYHFLFPYVLCWDDTWRLTCKIPQNLPETTLLFYSEPKDLPIGLCPRNV